MATHSHSPYTERTDAQKIKANWKKTRGLFLRKEYSMAVVRAAISVELAANLAIRAHYAKANMYTPEEVNDLLRAANGLRGKFQKHLLPSTRNTDAHPEMKHLNVLCIEINDERNSVCHSGAFKKRVSARRVIGLAHQVVVSIVQKHEPAFSIKAL